MNLISFSEVYFNYNDQANVLENATFRIPKEEIDGGSITALVGSSGSGKTTLINLILKNLKPRNGIIATHPTNPYISYIPQEPVLFDHLTPYENARYFSRLKNYKHRFSQSLFEKLCSVLSMSDTLRSTKSVSQLSGGQKTRLALIRALSIAPDILLLDEPTTGLDAEVKLEFLHQLRSLVLSQRILCIYATHHKSEIELMADYVIYLFNKTSHTHVFVNTLSAFIEAPPTVEAAILMNYPQQNTLYCRISNQRLEVCAPSESSTIALLKLDNIKFSEKAGMAYTVLYKNSLHSTIELSGNQRLSVPNELVNSGTKLSLHGRLSLYNRDTLFAKTVVIDNYVIL